MQGTYPIRVPSATVHGGRGERSNTLAAEASTGAEVFMRAILGVLAVCGASGCVRVQSTGTEQFSSEGVITARATVDDGNLSYGGYALEEVFDVTTTSWGFGSSKRKAAARRDDNRISADVIGEVLELQAFAGDRSGVDFDVFGPGFMNVDLVTESGSATVMDVEGFHLVTASSVFARGLVGDVDLYARSGGIDAEIFPYTDGLVIIESLSGDVDLYLPFGLEYDLTIVGDPEYEMVVEDLGFATLVLQPGLAVAQSGRRLVRVDVVVAGGAVRVYGSR